MELSSIDSAMRKLGSDSSTGKGENEAQAEPSLAPHFTKTKLKYNNFIGGRLKLNNFFFNFVSVLFQFYFRCADTFNVVIQQEETIGGCF